MNNLVTPRPVRADAARAAGTGWAARTLAERLAVIRRVRHLLAADAAALAASVGRAAVADTLVAEVLPLLEAARFLERRAPALLRPRRLRTGRPLWLLGVGAELFRDPLGAVLILAPGNYPLFLPGAQALQALAAGNAVAWKPAPNGVDAARAVEAALLRSGLPPGVLTVLDPADGPAAVLAGFDHVVLTGSAETGAAVLAAAAPLLLPCTMELSGSDPVFVLPGAELGLVARCLAYGLRLNGGATCIAPRRVFASPPAAAELVERLLPLLSAIPDAAVPPAVQRRLDALLADAAGAGATVHGGGGSGRPVVVSGAGPEMELLQRDVFAPWLALVPVTDMEEALRLDPLCPFALGASVFGPVASARAFAARLRAGSVCINDVITPTADPRLPFGGSGRSGFGRTRGADGLLAMTRLRTVSRRSWFRPHLSAPGPKDAGRFLGMIRLLHRPWFGR